MDSRQEPRFEIDQQISVILLGDSETVIPAKIVNLSGRGMGLECGLALPPGGAVKIELADTLLLGEVVYCRWRGGGYQVGIALEQVLYHTRGLTALAERLLGVESGQRSDTAVK
jgi:PilZ domain